MNSHFLSEHLSNWDRNWSLWKKDRKNYVVQMNHISENWQTFVIMQLNFPSNIVYPSSEKQVVIARRNHVVRKSSTFHCRKSRSEKQSCLSPQNDAQLLWTHATFLRWLDHDPHPPPKPRRWVQWITPLPLSNRPTSYGDMTHSVYWHDSFRLLSHDMTHSVYWHDSFRVLTWLIPYTITWYNDWDKTCTLGPALPVDSDLGQSRF